MLSAKRLAPCATVQLDATFLTLAFGEGCLAGSPHAVTVADPFACGHKDKTPAVPFLFSDIPDFHFREPRRIISISSFGGAKS